MPKRILWILAIALTALTLSHDAVSQSTRSLSMMKGMMTIDTDDNWISSRSTGDDIIVWGSGFGEMLELSPQQRDDLHEISENLRPLSQEELKAIDSRKLLSIEEMQQKLNQVLTPEQQLTFMEISFQAAGGLDSHLLNDQLLAVVNLSDAQKNQIRKLNADLWAEDYAERERRGEMKPFDWQNATQEERDKYIADIVSIQRANRESDEARIMKFTEQMKTVLTPEQKAKAEKLTAEASALIEELGFFQKDEAVPKQPQQQEPQKKRQVRGAPVYVPSANSWRPGDPLPEGAVPPPPRRKGFPRSESN